MFMVLEDGIDFLAFKSNLDEAQYVVEQEVLNNLGSDGTIHWEDWGAGKKAISYDGDEKDQVFVIRKTR